MPQTLLSILALVGAAFFTIGQHEGSANTLQSIIADEFEVAVAGALIQTIEYADSRAFDEATTPQALRVRLGLPEVLTQVALDTLSIQDVAVPTSSFASASQFGVGLGGATVRCDSRDQRASINCNDVSDIHDRSKSTWHDVTLKAPNGDPLPVEVHVEVVYVDATNPDVIVTNRRTNHKRVDVWARSPILTRTNPNHMVHMRRVISFDPAVALEYLKRTTCVVAGGNAAQVAAAQAKIAAAQAAAAAAHAAATAAQQTAASARATATTSQAGISTASSAAATALATANQRASQLSTANAAAASANSAHDASYSVILAAFQVYEARYAEHQQALSDVSRNNSKKNRDARDAAATAMDKAKSAMEALYPGYVAVRDAAVEANRAADAAQTASTAAWAAATTAQAGVATAQQAAQQSNAAALAAEASAATAAQTAAAADRALSDAVAALSGLSSVSSCRRA